jgi:hypothetical protein
MPKQDINTNYPEIVINDNVVEPTKPEAPAVDVKSQAPKFTHRYFCEGCTGIAFYWVEQGITPQTKFPLTCKTCGRVIGQIKPINFIKL